MRSGKDTEMETEMEKLALVSLLLATRWGMNGLETVMNRPFDDACSGGEMEMETEMETETEEVQLDRDGESCVRFFIIVVCSVVCGSNIMGKVSEI